MVPLRGESSEVFATPDGRLEAREHLRPVRARVDGQWRPVDITLAKSGDGTVAPKAATVGLRFSGGGDVPMVRMSKAGRELALSWPGKLPEPRLEEATAVYPDVLPGVDLRLGAQVDGFTQLLVVKTPDAARRVGEFKLTMATSGMSVRKTDAGGLAAVDGAAGGTVFEAAPPVMWDSKKDANHARAADDKGANRAHVGVDLASGGRELVLKPDTNLLTGADTVYPVFIDPQWYTPKATAWTMASKYWASSPQWKFNGDHDAGMGYCGWEYCNPYDVKRLFYRMPVSRFAGTTVLSAEFVVPNTWSASCTAMPVQLWRTKGISESTTWNTQKASGFWIDYLRTETFAYGYDGCAARDAEFDVKSVVQQAADGKWATITFGLRAPAVDESDRYSWKRFSDDAYLRVRYNRPPAQPRMSQLTMQYGGVCKQPGDAPWVRSLGVIYANNITDPDGDNVSVQFQAAWDGGMWQPARTAMKRSESDFSIQLSSSIPEDKAVRWYVRVYDGAQYSAWSHAGDPTACYFRWDTDAPKPPAISSGDYPVQDPEDPNDPWYDGMGKYGSFVIGGNDTQTTKYWYGINVDPSSDNTVTTTSGAARTLTFLPPRAGVNTLWVQSFDAAGNRSAPTGYRFRVKAGQPERATWQFDENAGQTQAQGSAPPRPLTLAGGTVLGAEGAIGTALALNGTDAHAATDLSVVDTTQSFSVSAWVKLDTLPGHPAVVAAQLGNETAGYELSYSNLDDRWVFASYAADKAGAGTVRAMPSTAGGVRVGTWTHLMGSFDASLNQLRLYVDGVLAGSTAHDIGWNAARGVRLGAGATKGVARDFLPGSLDQVEIFDRALADGEVAKLSAKEPVTGGNRPASAVFPLDEPAGATEVIGHAQVMPAVFRGGASAGAVGVRGKALSLDGTDDHAVVSTPHINTFRSFAVSVWARLEAKPGHSAVLLTQQGQYRSGVELFYSAHLDRWVLNQHKSDAPDAGQVLAVQSTGGLPQAGEWAHLVGVHDTVADTLTLYVNGVKAGQVTLDSPWYAAGAFQVGAGLYSGVPGNFFPGQIDDIRLFDRVLSADEVKQLFKQRPVVAARWLFTESSGTPPVTPDASSSGNAMTLYGGAQVGPGGIDGTVTLDGVDDYAVTAKSPLDTGTSFTISAWAQTAAVPDRQVTLLSVPSTQQSALAVRYVPSSDPTKDPGRWRIVTADKDTADATLTTIDNGLFFSATEWNHVALVYDAFADELMLYVNGGLQDAVCADDSGEDSAGCVDLASWKENVMTFKSAQPMQLGRVKTGSSTWGEHWPGAVSDVWAFHGALTDLQIDHLSIGASGLPTEVPGGIG
ncbi:LamG-like jellyroll fold domain-containing protein [Nonomuraea sp. KM88]|uniref:LamG-like jellyroll fold domain-containing protein n=1 Tax=Nonomuraea sp. KM88 TaxID=3457427 RepID=UPI003FCC4532